LIRFDSFDWFQTLYKFLNQKYIIYILKISHLIKISIIIIFGQNETA